MMNEILVSAATLLVGGNVVSAVSWAKAQARAKLSSSLKTELEIAHKNYEELVELNDSLLFEKFHELGPTITAFLKKNPGIIPFSALDGVEFTREQMEAWILKNEGKLSEEFKQTFCKGLTKPHIWETISKVNNLTRKDSNISITLTNEKCKKCGMIHRFSVPLETSEDGFYMGREKRSGPGQCIS